MANHKSSLKRIRVTRVKTQRNRFYRTRLKNIVRTVNEAVDSSNKELADKAMLVANKEIHKFVSKGFLKKNTAARKVSRLQLKVNLVA